MEPKTTGPGESNLTNDAHEVGVNVSFHAETRAVLPSTGADLTGYTGSFSGALIAAGFILCVVAHVMRKRGNH